MGMGVTNAPIFWLMHSQKSIRSQMFKEKDALRLAIESSRGARGGHSEQAEDATSELMRRILKTAYLRTDKEFISPKTAPQSGSTAATVILMGRRLFAANVGDSRVVLCRGGGQCVELTSDHKPSRPDEAARVRAAGGFLLLACDGLFDVFRSQDAIALARQELIAHRGQPAEVARILSDQAIRVRRSRDNVSILIIVLRPFWEL